MKFYFSAMSLLRVVVAMIVSAYFVPGADAQASSANSMPQTDESAGLAEVVVTAQRRSEDVQKVPISVAAVSGDLLTAQNIMSMANLAAVVPGLIVTPNVADAQIFVRGIGTTGEGIEGDVGLYIDGVYIPSQSASLINLSNIDHIEVLKGPQGTLFGRNAVGGAIQVVTKDPSHTTSADMSLGYSNYSTGTANFYGTAGLTDDLAVDLAVYGNRQWDGWGTDLVTHEALFTSDVLQIRNKWLFTPTSGTKITLALDYSRESN